LSPRTRCPRDGLPTRLIGDRIGAEAREAAHPIHLSCRFVSAAARLSDPDLLRRVTLLAGAERETTVDLVAHLAELDARRLYLEKAAARCSDAW